MLFNIVIDPPAVKELQKIKRGTPHVASLLIKKIDTLSVEPYAGKPLRADKRGCYSLREGDYRAIYEIYLDDKTVHIIAIGHRKDIYR